MDLYIVTVVFNIDSRLIKNINLFSGTPVTLAIISSNSTPTG